MMRMQGALSSLLAAALVPTLFLSGGELESLESALRETTRALEVVGGLAERAESGDPASVGAVRGVTEAPILDARGRDERLVDLRNQVNLLQAELDVLEVPALPSGAPVPPPAAAPAGAGELPSVSTGLAPDRLAALAAVARPGDAEPATRTPPSAAEGPGYSADPVAHARACYYAKRYERALELTEPLTDDADAWFWRARALEKLDRLDQAVEAMRRASELAGEGPVARKAKAELEFLEWRRDFRADAPHRRAGSARGGPR